MIKAIFFDFGGVIYQHPKQVIPEVLAKIYNKPLKLTSEEYANYSEDYLTGKIGTEELIITLSFLFKSHKSIEEVKNLWLKYYGDLSNPNQEVIRIIKVLSKKYKVYLFSNTTEMSDQYNKTTGIYDNFDGLFFSFQMGMVKPDHKIYEALLQQLNLKASQAVLIDDDPANIDMAKLLGFKVVTFDVLKDPVSKLKTKLLELING